MNDQLKVLTTCLSQLGFVAGERLKVLSRYPDGLIFLQYAQSQVPDRSADEFLNFHITAALDRMGRASVQYVTVALHIMDPNNEVISWIAAQRSFWKDEGTIPPKDQMVAMLLTFEVDLFRIKMGLSAPTKIISNGYPKSVPDNWDRNFVETKTPM